MKPHAAARLLLVLCLATGLWVTFHGARDADARPAAPGQPDVILLIADDLNTRLGCYGDPVVKTPNLDRLAREGRRFDAAYCQYPLCNPSRASFLTGRRPEVTRVWTNTDALRSGKGTVTLPEYFGRHGYLTVGLGKVFHGADPKSWTIFTQTRAARRRDRPTERARPPGGRDPQDGIPVSWQAVDGPDSAEQDGEAARQAVRILEEERTRPLFLAVGFHRPHVPWRAPRPYFDLYAVDRLPVAEPRTQPAGGAPAASSARPSAKLFLENPTRARQQEAIRAYYASVSFMDAQAGLVLDALRRRGALEKSVVVFMSDHGYSLGEHGIWGKRLLYDSITRVPLVVAGTGVRHAGTVAHPPVELIDLFPTLTDLCGLPPRPGLDGTSLRPLLEDADTLWNRPARSMVRGEGLTGQMVRHDRWHYNQWGRPDRAELYDLVADPGETRNLAREPRHAERVAELRRLLR